ncbi:hypothetical protein PDESU_05937 [Pontiella desulfatans]|uniref:Inner membrane protein YphA n=1 Tax=Pontiella desulfatans TaxID=2750659 RepID=A0A6C2UD43_PONDE|nr:DoxX family protein [Pontiella desulfatans]VGO17341.1 hypothetical protein PDESU_05937 [Pontiella desulfatans]
MNALISTLLNIVGRLLFIGIFLMSALGNKIPKFNDVSAYMASEGVPALKLLLAGAIVFLVAGSLSVLMGYKARIGAALLMVFLLLATYWFHDFWTFDDPAQVQQQTISFMKNLALIGATLMIIAHGAGTPVLDSRK